MILTKTQWVAEFEGRTIDARLTQDAISAINAKCRHLRKEKRDAEDAAKAGPKNEPWDYVVTAVFVSPNAMAKAEAGRSTTARVRIFTREKLLTRTAGSGGRRLQLDMSRIEAITAVVAASHDDRIKTDSFKKLQKCSDDDIERMGRFLEVMKLPYKITVAMSTEKDRPRDSPSEEARIMEGKVQLMFTNPETLVLDPKWRDLLMAERFQHNIIGIVVDHVHKTPSCRIATGLHNREAITVDELVDAISNSFQTRVLKEVKAKSDVTAFLEMSATTWSNTADLMPSDLRMENLRRSTLA
ncbi:Hypp6228 [Branchiostoma lanceolatum]|uniref:Hypp6228 protein n=1 Tax=Branchiostoma lanceolatum TaxID=7740 RepID=A0A8J9WI11_BRALA|nr:Hypp6228 [Branchiostoma lanceolatum]